MPLHDMNSVGRFADRADDYVRYRPSYPAEAIDAILEGLGDPRQLLAADIGAGTGISACLLGDRGVRVIAVEPGESMRGAAAPHPNVFWIAGLAEASGLRSRCCDLVLSAQAFHWFRPDAALREFGRVLKDHGRLAIVWNRRDNADALTDGYGRAIQTASDNASAERMAFDPSIVGASGLFGPIVRRQFGNRQRLDFEGLVGRARSASYVPKTGPMSQELIEELRGLHRRYADEAGFVTLVYETEVYLAERAG